jgi:S-layer protein
MAAVSDIQKIYIGYFGRAADPSGLNYWLNPANTSGMTLSNIATSFSVQDEAKAMYAYLAFPSMGLSPKDFLQSVYQNLFNRGLDAAGETYWTGKLAASGATVGSVILDIISGAQSADRAVLNNKVTVADYYTTKVASSGATWGGADQANDIADARAVVAGVGTDASVATGKALADAKIAADVAGDPPVTYTLSVDAPKVTEGNSGTKELVFTLTLDKAPTSDVTVNYVVASGGTATANDDFVAAPGSVVFAAGKTAASVTVSVLGDNKVESNETIQLTFTGSKLAASVTANGTITDNDASPVFTSSAAPSVAENTTAVVQIAATDADGDAVTATISGGADAARFSLSASGALSFNAAPNFEAPADAGADNTYNVTIRASDVHGNTTDQALAVKVTNVNEAPTAAAAQSVSGTEDVAATVTVAATDVDGDTLSYTAGAASHGTVTGAAGGVFTYTPTANYNGTDSFVVTASDGKGGTVNQTVNLTLAAVNDAPTVAATQSVSGTEDVAATVTVAATDVDGDTLSYTAGAASHGTVTGGAGGVFTYTPTANYNGTDSFVVTASDGKGGTVNQTVNLTLAAVNDAPVAVADATASVVVGQSVTINVLANDTDVDGNTLTISGTPTVTSGGGTVSVSGNQLVYTAGSAGGGATIAYKITDGNAVVDGLTQAVSIGEAVLTPAAASVNEGQNVVFNLTGAPSTTYAVQVTSSNLAEVSSALISVTTNASGAASLTYATTADRLTEASAQSVSANIIGTQAAAVSVSVADTSKDNVAPTVAATQSVSGTEDTASTVTVSATDPDGDALTYSAGAAANGTVTGGTGGVFTYTPTANYNGTDSFIVTATDALGAKASQTVSVTLAAVNDAPTITVPSNAVSVAENTTSVFTFAPADVDAGDTLSAVTLSGDDASLFQIVGSSLAFRGDAPNYEAPNDANRDGIYRVTLGVTDSTGAAASQAIAVTVTDVAEPGTFFLTGNPDRGAAYVGTAFNDTYIANQVGGLTALDEINGGLGTDTLSVVDTTTPGVVMATSASVQNIEVANFTLAGKLEVNASGWTGLTTLTTSTYGGATVTAPTAAALTLTDNNLAAGAISVDGGAAVNITATSVTTGAITVGKSTAPSGAVVIASSITDSSAAGKIAVTGGTTISVTQTSADAGATHGSVEINGGTGTTSVSAVATATVKGATNNTVNITDASNNTDVASSITSATVSGYTTLAIVDNALSTLSLANGTGNIIIDNSGTVTVTPATTLNMTVNGLTGGTLDDADIYTTLNIATTGEASKLANVTFGAATTLAVSGDKVLTLTSAAGLSALKTATVSGSAGLSADISGASITSISTAATTGNSTITMDATKSTFTGGAGKDAVTTSAAAPTKAISLGDGDDSVTLAAGTTAVTGTITGGNGTDTLQMRAADADTASTSGKFASLVTGFEALTLAGATNQTVALDTLGGYNSVTTSGGNGLTLSGIASGGTLTLNGAGTAYTLSNTGFAAGTADVLNVVLTDGSKAGVAFAGTGITASGVERFNVTVTDTQEEPSGGFQNTLTILGNSAKTIVASGNAGLDLTAASTAITSVDASGLTLGAFTFTSGALTAAASITGTTKAANTVDFAAATGGAVTYIGGSGADAITASNGKNNVITLGDGTNSVTVTGSSGNNTITGGAGADTVTLTDGNNVVSLGNGANGFLATTGNNTYTGGSGVDTVEVGGGLNTLTTGTGADVISITAAGANVNIYTTITDPHAGMQIGVANLGTETFRSDKVTLASTAMFQDYANAVVADASQADHSSDGAWGWFQFGGNTFLQQVRHDTTGGINQSFVNGTDFIVALVGLVDLSTATGGTTNILTLA